LPLALITMINTTNKTGLILSGGGARAAYQVGVLKAIAHSLPKNAKNPFPVICGTSAGSINATTLAIYANQFRHGVKLLSHVWENFHVNQVFRADPWGLFSSGMHWMAAIAFRGLGRQNPMCLLDRAPLRILLSKMLPCHKIQQSINSGVLDALSITTSCFTTGQSVTFFQGRDDLLPWKRVRRIGIPGKITLDHLMASSAIPFLFAPERIQRSYYGDGSMRQTAPISPALHLGANRILVIGVRKPGDDETPAPTPNAVPSLAAVGGHLLNSIFLDSMDTDLERLQRINGTISLIPSHHLKERDNVLRPIEVFTISPSQDIGNTALKHAHQLPRTLRMIFNGIGAMDEQGIDLLSYLLFESSYCNELMELGYRDTMAQKSALLSFLAN